MGRKKQFGTFAGVFTPSLLTILGVIMYLRMGWVVGNAGLVGTILIVVLAHVISVSTGLSVSSIATDKRVGAGGIYYILSRSMGIPIGGAIGLALYVGTALSIALYLVGFAESLNGYLGFDTSVNGLRITGSIALFSLTAIALISTSVALKTQFFILAAIIVSLVSIFFGSREFAPPTVPQFAGAGALPLEMVFAVYFPAVTGFTAGIAMSGDLKDPKKSIPVGTIAAIAVGFVTYIGLAVFIAMSINPELLRTDYGIVTKIAFFTPAVIAGVWGATLSSALGGVLGGPRILQAMSVDKVTPGVFGRGKGKNNEPVNALLLVIVIAFAGILIGELDVIARVVSMFYLAAYGFICLSFFLESWANPDFQPTFKVNRWIGLIGFAACFGIMFKLDMIAMFASIIVILGIHFWLQRKRIELDTGNVWHSVWEKVVASGLNKLETKPTSATSWNPNIILFSGDSSQRPHLLEFSKAVAGSTGIVTNFSFKKKEANDAQYSKTRQIQKDETLEKLGIFGRKVQVDNIYDGVQNVATTFGFSGVDPNTAMLGWPSSDENSSEFARMTQSLVQLDYNILYIAFDEEVKFGERQSIDLWWRMTDSNNAEMMLNISRFLAQSPKWAKAAIRILYVQENDSDISFLKSKISNLIEELRIKAEIKIVDNTKEHLPIQKIIEIQSANTDLVVTGIPEVDPENLDAFIEVSNKLIRPTGTTLLVRAAESFNELNLSANEEAVKKKQKTSSEIRPLPVSEIAVIDELVSEFDNLLSSTSVRLTEAAISPISVVYKELVDDIRKSFLKTEQKLASESSVESAVPEIQRFVAGTIDLVNDFGLASLGSLHSIFVEELGDFVRARNHFRSDAIRSFKLDRPDDEPVGYFNKKLNIKWKTIVGFYFDSTIIPYTQESFYEFGKSTYTLLTSLTEALSKETHLFLESTVRRDDNSLTDFSSKIKKILDDITARYQKLEQRAKNEFLVKERNICIELAERINQAEFGEEIAEQISLLRKKDSVQYQSNVAGYADDWLRVQRLAHSHVEAELNLVIAGLSIFRINERIKRRVNNTIISAQKRKIKLLDDAISKHKIDSKDKESVKAIDNKVESIADNLDRVNFRNLFDNEEAAILSISGAVPQEVELISARSIGALRECQNDDLETVTINLAKILNYIVQTSYLAPLQTAKETLGETYDDVAEDIYSCANLYTHIFQDAGTGENEPEEADIVAEVSERIVSAKELVAGSAENFNHALTTNLYNTHTQLGIRTLLQSEALYSKFARAPLGSGMQTWLKGRQDSARDSYDDVINRVTRERQKIDNLKFELSGKQLANINEQVSDFIASISVKPAVNAELPFYLKRLFADRQIGSAKKLTKESDRVKIQKAINRIDNGTSGAIIVLGESLSGKTNYTETISRTMLKGERFVVSPPSNQSFTPNDLHLAIQKTFSREGTTRSVFSRLDRKSIIIFNDIERWWIKSSDGKTVLNYLANIINEFGSRHYFLLNCNIHSYNIIRKLTSLERQLLTTIVMPPPTKVELKQVIIDRYKIAGIELLYKGVPLDEARNADALFSELYSQSGGKIGVALNSWVSNIYRDEDGKLSVALPEPVGFPDIRNPYWKIVLYYLLIHKRLSNKHLRELFQTSEMVSVQNTLDEMEKAELVYKLFNNTYVLKKTARHYIESWLKGLKILG